MDDLDSMTGLNDGGGARTPILDTLSLNGDAEIVEKSAGVFEPKGGFYRLTKNTTAKKGEKPEEVKLGKEVKVIFLKVRRALQERSGDKMVRWTSEHSQPDDIVEVRTPERQQRIEVGSARMLREKYSGLHTIQFVYGLLLQDGKQPELIKMRFKGSALGSEVKDKNNQTFYEYISTERKDAEGKKEHLRHFETVLTTAKEVGKKTYFTVVFNRGAELTPELKALADEKLREIHAQVLAADDARFKRIKQARESGAAAPAEAIDEDVEDAPGAEGGADAINPDDIPF